MGREHVLIHCKNSRSRSPTVLLVYFILFRGLPASQARSCPSQLPRNTWFYNESAALHGYALDSHRSLGCSAIP